MNRERPVKRECREKWVCPVIQDRRERKDNRAARAKWVIRARPVRKASLVQWVRKDRLDLKAFQDQLAVWDRNYVACMQARKYVVN